AGPGPRCGAERPRWRRGVAVAALALGLARHAQRGRGRRRRCRGAPTRMWAAKYQSPNDIAEEKVRKKSLDDEVQSAVEAASPVPQTFDQACAWASAAALNAVSKGKMLQTMYFNAGGSDDADIQGDLGNVLDFAETFSKMLCQAAPLEEGIVRVVLPDLGAAAMVKQKWETNSDAGELPENMHGLAD
ncbi:unnamed protein product, partial [Prorocentrum cordatum]